jgi:hypothetical protein
MEYNYNDHNPNNNVNGRASLPKSAFSKEWYEKIFVF